MLVRVQGNWNPTSVDGNVKRYSCCEKQCGSSSKITIIIIIIIRLPHDPAIHFCLYTPKNWEQDLKKYLDIHIHSSTLYNCQRAEATQVSTEGRVDKKMWYTRTMEWYSALKGRKFCSTMDEPWGHDVIWKEASLNKTRRFHLYEWPRVVQFIET